MWLSQGKHSLDVTVILSKLSNVSKVMGYFTTAIQRLSSHQKRRVDFEPGELEEAFKDIPSLI
jgi:hypothetical protein